MSRPPHTTSATISMLFKSGHNDDTRKFAKISMGAPFIGDHDDEGDNLPANHDELISVVVEAIKDHVFDTFLDPNDLPYEDVDVFYNVAYVDTQSYPEESP